MDKRGAFVVSGGSKGLGKAVGRAAYEQGYPVALIARDEAHLASAQVELVADSSIQGRVSIHAADLTDARQTERAFGEILAAHKCIHTVVNNAATWTGGSSIRQLSAEDILRSFHLNFLSAFHATKEALRAWEQGGRGPLCIINIGATASLRGGKNSAAFAIAKGALRSFSQSLAKEMGPEGVHVAHLVIDGLINNERTRGLNASLADERFMNPASLASYIVQISEQEPSCWVFESDLRPFNERWS
jgi:short-subunit dehydrogenase